MYPNSVKDCLHNLSKRENGNIQISPDKYEYYRGLIVGLLSGLNQRMSYTSACKLIRENLPDDCVELDKIVSMFVDDIYHAKTHYIVVGGLRGYMPNFCEVYTNKSGCYDHIAFIHELSTGYIAKLARENGDYVPLNLHKHGNEYSSITECQCMEPHIHQDNYFDRHSFWLNNPEFYT